ASRRTIALPTRRTTSTAAATTRRRRHVNAAGAAARMVPVDAMSNLQRTLTEEQCSRLPFGHRYGERYDRVVVTFPPRPRTIDGVQGDEMPPLAVYLLGAPRIEADGQPIEVDTRKATALVAYLAMDGQPRSRDALAELLWPDAESGRAALRRTLSVLGKALGGRFLAV